MMKVDSTVTVRERPVLFSVSMVRAILSGSKSQTRRVLKPQPSIGVPDEYIGWTGWNESFSTHDIRESDTGVVDEWMCPYGYKGQRLWVKETWYAQKCHDNRSPEEIKKSCVEAGYGCDEKHPACGLWYDADDSHRQWGDMFEVKGKKRVSIHMPRWASRITLEIEAVRVERLQDITYRDCEAEGLLHVHRDWWVNPFSEDVQASGDTEGWKVFKKLWNSINGDGSWAENPWVWVIQFKRVTS